VKELAHRLGGSIADSDVAEQARDRFERATHKGADIVQTVREAVPTGKNGEA
jgi:hypothetical protein